MCAQSCPTLCDPMDYSLSGSSVLGLSRQTYWNGLPFPIPGDLSNPGIEPISLASAAQVHWRADSLHCATWEALLRISGDIIKPSHGYGALDLVAYRSPEVLTKGHSFLKVTWIFALEEISIRRNKYLKGCYKQIWTISCCGIMNLLLL